MTESVDPAVFRMVLSQFASGVVVASGQTPDGPAGLTCQSFSSLSLDPPLVLLCPARTSKTWPHIAATGHFAINVLSTAQQPVSERFARSGGDKFARIGWHPGVMGNPLIDGALAHIECDVDAVHIGGDHLIVVGRVRALEVDGVEPGTDPLVYFRSGYRRLSNGA